MDVKINALIRFPRFALLNYSWHMKNQASALAGWTPVDLERIRRHELRTLDTYQTIALLCGPADYTVPPRVPKPTSGLVEQQRWFMKAAKRG